MMRRFRTLAATGLLCAAACDNAGEKISVPEFYTGSFNVQFYLDVDGDGARTANDAGVAGGKVVLFSAYGTDTLRTATSNDQGQIIFEDLPLGSYRYSIVGSSIGDSLTITEVDSSRVRILARLDSVTDLRAVQLSYPTLTSAQVKTAAPGRRVMFRGKVLAPPQNFQTPMSFIGDAAGAVRITGTTTPDGQADLVIGDSVLVTGTTGTSQGQPVLTNGVVRFLATRPPTLPRITTAADARTANGGALDAMLVQVSGIRISDTVMTSTDYRVTVASVADAEDKVVVLIDHLIDVAHPGFFPGRNIVVRGVLVPLGDGTWAIRPRTVGDVTFP